MIGIDSLHSRPRSLVLLGLLAAPVAASEEQTVPLGARANQALLVPLAEPRPEPDWNCFDITLAETSIRAILPSDAEGDPERGHDLLRLAKFLAEDLDALTAGPVGAGLAAGTIFGVEFDLFPNDDGVKPTAGECLDLSVTLTGEGLDGQPAEMGTIYCFDQAQYWARVGALGAVPARVWPGFALHASFAGVYGLRLSGSMNDFVGDVRSNGTIFLGGFGNSFVDEIWFQGIAGVRPENQYGSGLLQATPGPLRASPHDAAWYAAQAEASGTKVLGDVIVGPGEFGRIELLGESVDGKVVYATGSITVEGNLLSGAVTLVAEGDIEIDCGNSQLAAARDDVLAVKVGASPGSVSISGSGNVLVGTVHAAQSSIRYFGSDNELTGAARARKVKVLGSGNSFSAGTH